MPRFITKKNICNCWVSLALTRPKARFEIKISQYFLVFLCKKLPTRLRTVSIRSNHPSGEKENEYVERPEIDEKIEAIKLDLQKQGSQVVVPTLRLETNSPIFLRFLNLS